MHNTLEIVYRIKVPDPLIPTSDSPNLVLPGDLPSFVETSHTYDLHYRHSTAGLALMLAGDAVSYRSLTQTITATSPTDMESFTAVSATKHAKSLMRAILHEHGFSQRAPTPIFEDNMSAINM